MTGRNPASDRGTITSFAAVMALAFIMVAGMAYDGGQVLSAHTSARAYATKAARAAAQEIDLAALRQTGIATLDPGAAEAAALSYLDQIGVDGTVSVAGNTATVTVTIVQPIRVLPLPDRTVVATESASALSAEAPTAGELTPRR
jgi:hypothetical protein